MENLNWMQSNGVKYPLNPDFYFLERPDPKYTAPFAAYDRIRALPPLSSLHRNERSAALWRLRVFSISTFSKPGPAHSYCLLDQKVQWEDPCKSDWFNCSLTIIVKAGRRILCCQHQKSKGGRELSVWSQRHISAGESSLFVAKPSCWSTDFAQRCESTSWWVE